jgi:hypothetical protein
MHETNRQNHMRNIVIVTLAAILVAACAEKPTFGKARAEMTQRERDSTVAASGLPGAGVVKKGMAIADMEARHAAMLDSIGAGN